MRVLLIDDDQEDQDLISSVMDRIRDPKCVLEIADTFQAGIKRLASGDIQVLLLDLHLPGATGLDGLGRVRGLSDVAVVVLTDVDEEATARLALRRGAQDYLVKGRVTESELGRALRYAFERAAGERARRDEESLGAVHQLALAASHEINNPLAVILGHLQILGLTGRDDASFDSRIDAMKKAAYRIRDITTLMGRTERLAIREDSGDLPQLLDPAPSAGMPPVDDRPPAAGP